MNKIDPSTYIASSLEEALATGKRWSVPENEKCFVGLTKKTIPSSSAECPCCLGYGNWVSTVNAYPNMENKKKGINRGDDFLSFCLNCNGWGYVSKKEANHIHNWEFVRTVGNCLKLYKCSICNKQWEIDSSG